MMADALANAADTKACVVGSGAADGAAVFLVEYRRVGWKGQDDEDYENACYSFCGGNACARRRCRDGKFCGSASARKA
jgi:hypothetical protein